MVAPLIIIGGLILSAIMLLPIVLLFISGFGFVNSIITNQWFVGGAITIILYYASVKLKLIPPIKKWNK